MQLYTEFVRGANLQVKFNQVSNNLNYDFITPAPMNIEFNRGKGISTVFARPNNTLKYEFSIGAQGPSGVPGARGSLWTSSPFAPSNTFGENNDIHLNTTTYDLFQKFNGSWNQIGNIKGPTGPAGDGQGILPAGGTTGQRLAKASNVDFDVVWVNDIYNTYIHTQSVTSNTWNINHQLNKFPSVTVVDTTVSADGIKVIGDIEYVDNNNITITFVHEILGKAYLN